MIDIHVPAFDFFLYFLILAIVFFMFGYGNSLINSTKGFSHEQVKEIEEQLRKITEYAYVEVQYNDPAYRITQDRIQQNSASTGQERT